MSDAHNKSSDVLDVALTTQCLLETKHLLSFYHPKVTTVSLLCLEGEGEVRAIQMQHATSPLDVTEFDTLNLYVKNFTHAFLLCEDSSVENFFKYT